MYIVGTDQDNREELEELLHVNNGVKLLGGNSNYWIYYRISPALYTLICLQYTLEDFDSGCECTKHGLWFDVSIDTEYMFSFDRQRDYEKAIDLLEKQCTH